VQQVQGGNAVGVGFVHPFPMVIQQESKVLILVPRVATGNPLNQPEVSSTDSKVHWMPLKLATIRLKTRDKEGHCKSRFEINHFSIMPNFEKWL
jgi:hypothetical protein